MASQRPTHNVMQEVEKYNKPIADDQYSSQPIYTIQTGSFIEIERAQMQFDSIVQILNKRELEYLRIEKVDKYYSVRLGKFSGYTNTEKLFQTIKPQLSSAIIMKAYIKDERIISLYKDTILSDS
jgi:hypothetical protein